MSRRNKSEHPHSKRWTYKDSIYQFMHSARMKIGQQWLMCVIYQSYKDKKIYVRERGDFYEKFLPLNDNLNA